MNNYFSVAIGILASIGCAVFGLYANDEKRKTWAKRMVIFLMVLSTFLLIFGLVEDTKKQKKLKEEKSFSIIACKNYYDEENYGLAYECLKNIGVDDPKAKLIFGYFLIRGIGTEQDIEKGIEYYKSSMDSGEKNAESCLVVAALKYLNDASKIEIIKCAYDNGNETAVRYIDELEFRRNAWTENSTSDNNSTIWDLPEEEILEILDSDKGIWVSSNKTYAISVSTASTPYFTRRFLYNVGMNSVYEESVFIPSLPEWLNEVEEEKVWSN